MSGEVNNENPCNPQECFDGQWYEIVIDCAEEMGIPCENGEYVDPPEGECCSICIEYDNEPDATLYLGNATAIPNSEVSLDGDTLRAEATAEKEQLIEQLRENLEQTSRKALMEAQRDESDFQQETLRKVPYPIYTG